MSKWGLLILSIKTLKSSLFSLTSQINTYTSITSVQRLDYGGALLTIRHLLDLLAITNIHDPTTLFVHFVYAIAPCKLCIVSNTTRLWIDFARGHHGVCNAHCNRQLDMGVSSMTWRFYKEMFAKVDEAMCHAFLKTLPTTKRTPQ